MNRKISLLIALAAVCLLAMALYAEKPIKIAATDPIGVAIDMSKGPGCLKRGAICSMEATAQHKRQPGMEMLGELFVNDQQNLVLRFEKNQLTPALIVEQFQDDRFPITEAFDLPPAVLRELGVKGLSYRVQTGNYPVVISKEAYTVYLDVVAKKK